MLTAGGSDKRAKGFNAEGFLCKLWFVAGGYHIWRVELGKYGGGKCRCSGYCWVKLDEGMKMLMAHFAIFSCKVSKRFGFASAFFHWRWLKRRGRRRLRLHAAADVFIQVQMSHDMMMY